MKVLTAERCGFCFGVRRAIELAESTLAQDRPVYCLGPLIHNPQVIDRLVARGIHLVERSEEVPPGSTVIIRSHGVHPSVMEALRQRPAEIVDATCPLVKRAQDRARELAQEGYRVVIVGERHHPEVEAIVGIVGEAALVADEEPPREVLGERKIGVIAQTTQDSDTLRRVVHRLVDSLVYELRVFNTICSATVERQQAAVELAGQVEVMFVLGGHNSANTGRLAEICAGTGVPTYHLETVQEFRPEMIAGKQVSGVTAGASTPDWVIDEFVEKLKRTP